MRQYSRIAKVREQLEQVESVVAVLLECGNRIQYTVSGCHDGWVRVIIFS